MNKIKSEKPTADRRAKLSKQTVPTNYQKNFHPNFANRVQILSKLPKLWIRLLLKKRKSDIYIFFDITKELVISCHKLWLHPG